MKMNTDHQNAIHPDVTKIITGTLRKYGYCGCELREAVAEVSVRIIEAVEDRKTPATLGEWKALGAKIAAAYAVDEHRKWETSEQYDEGPCEQPDDYVALVPSGEQRDPVDAKRQLTVLFEMFDNGEMPEKGWEILLGVADRVKLPQIGRELGLPTEVVRTRLRVMRARYFRRLGALGMQ